jgi:general stress protein 26
LTLIFFANNVTHKFDEIEQDPHVNVSFSNFSTTAWASWVFFVSLTGVNCSSACSFSGKARIIRDREVIKSHWSSTTAAWFNDLKDGVHKGDVNDPRVSLIEVIPEEIRFWYPTKGKIGRAVEVGVGAVTGKTASPGDLLTITNNEVGFLF